MVSLLHLVKRQRCASSLWSHFRHLKETAHYRDRVIHKQDIVYTDDMRYDMYRLISGHSTAVYLLYVFDVCQGHYPRTARETPEAYHWSNPVFIIIEA